ncbi:MAG: dephospho-CoA kinase [Flavobacteriales bacterium]
MKRVFCVTGGIGSGKSTVCEILENKGMLVYYSDERAKFLMSHNHDLKRGIVAIFGNNSYMSNGTLDRSFLSAEIFADSSLRLAIEELVHPVVREDFDLWLLQNDASIVFKESALVLEKTDRSCQEILVIIADEERRIQRVLLRSPELSRPDIMNRISKQTSDQTRREGSSFIIENNSDKKTLEQQVDYFLASVI